jgi:hypothetical protein
VSPGRDPLRLVLEPIEGAASLRATFHGPGGKPLAGVEIGFDAEEGEESFAEVVDGQGRIVIEALLPGEYDVSFLEPAEGEQRAWGCRLRVAPGEDLELSFEEATPRGSLRGRLLETAGGEPVGLTLRPEEEPTGTFGFLAATRAGPEGRFAFEAVPPGRYVVGVEGGDRVGEASVEILPGRESWLEIVLGERPPEREPEADDPR